MNPNTIHHVQSNWAQVLPVAPQAAAIFCDELFTLDPPLRYWAQVQPVAPQAAAISCDELFTLDPPLSSLFKGACRRRARA